ncbi:alpha-N-acetylglucosaminidase [Neokomagataea thailandica]|uniref:Alpha-N-acetylglucosaminidase n=1 Tax=Neokomagataea tanensis NBRC 106556 TaxID=1223519 RepID=A0ABQ0QGK6_9PROT|nr:MULTISPECIES: alpha-N-acetylglucosaminidase [Neokomagataea]GBR43961.1 alpha-N-acetylglucosaminidase [Neokomagataea tanensis NBRC 106556]
MVRRRLGWMVFGASLPLMMTSIKAADDRALQQVVGRQFPGWEDHFRFVLTPDEDKHDHFSIAENGSKITVSGNTSSALLTGVGWYFKYGAHQLMSSNGVPVEHPFVASRGGFHANKRSSVQYRYALNQNVDGYTTAYWSDTDWQHELDIYALSGINTMLVERATEAVIAKTFSHFGYTEDDIRATLSMPAHLNWQLMGNLCCFGGPPSKALLKERILSTQHIVKQMRSLGMMPVFPGFYGMVPGDFAKRFPKAHVINQGTWNGSNRPAWLDPRDPLFPKIAREYYKVQKELFGDSSIYDLELFQEGGMAGDVPLKPAISVIEQSLQEAHPGARWMILGWRDQPAKEILEVVPHDKMFIVDLHQNAVRRPDRGADFLGADYVYSGLWDYGGRVALGGEAYDYGVRLPTLPATQPSMVGMGIYTEGMDNNPYLFDLFNEASWHDKPMELEEWTKAFAVRRYGVSDLHLQKAWQGLLKTVYSKTATLPHVRDEDDAAPIESLFNATPDLDLKRSNFHGSVEVYYDFSALQAVMEEFLKAPASFDQISAYRYDLVDVTRQVLANQARILLPKIKVAYEAGDLAHFQKMTQAWLALMDMQDELLGTNEFFRLGRWLSFPSGWAHSPQEARQLSYDARSLLTSWGNRSASDAGQLHDYANKDWQGLTRDLYRKRWEAYFASLEVALKVKARPKKIDWYPMADDWNHQMNVYTAAPQGSAREVAAKIDHFLRTQDAY